MKTTDRDLLNDLFPATDREASLQSVSRIMRRRRFIRRASQSITIATVALVAAAVAIHKPDRSPALVIASENVSKPASLTDSQLMALFPGVPRALMTVNGKKRLVFLRTADAVRYVGRAAPGGA
jgi:hypothetical protein